MTGWYRAVGAYPAGDEEIAAGSMGECLRAIVEHDRVWTYVNDMNNTRISPSSVFYLERAGLRVMARYNGGWWLLVSQFDPTTRFHAGLDRLTQIAERYPHMRPLSAKSAEAWERIESSPDHEKRRAA